MIIFDTNMILRYLLNDNTEMAEKAEQYLSQEMVAVTIEVIAEVIYVLRGVYCVDRKRIADTVTGFLQAVQCRDRDVLSTALEVYGSENLDFVDCVLYGYHKVRNMEVATFDKKLLHFLNR